MLLQYGVCEKAGAYYGVWGSSRAWASFFTRQEASTIPKVMLGCASHCQSQSRSVLPQAVFGLPRICYSISQKLHLDRACGWEAFRGSPSPNLMQSQIGYQGHNCYIIRWLSWTHPMSRHLEMPGFWLQNTAGGLVAKLFQLICRLWHLKTQYNTSGILGGVERIWDPWMTQYAIIVRRPIIIRKNSKIHGTKILLLQVVQ